MAKTTTVKITDDLDGSADAETIQFSLKGSTYEIDLSTKNQAALEKVLKPYIDAGTKVGGRARGGRGGRARSTSSKSETTAIREWASKNGHSVSTRGRISAAVVEAYHASK